VLAIHAGMAIEPAVEARAGLASAADCAWKPVALADQEEAQGSVPAAKTMVCRKPTGPLVKAMVRQELTAPAGSPTIEAIAPSGRLAQA
jgi:hypothetical protein